MVKRVTVRFEDETMRDIEELIAFYQKDSIATVTVSDVIRKSIECLHKSELQEQE